MTFTLTMIPRNLTRDEWTKLFRVLRKNGDLLQNDDPLATRAAVKAELEASVVDGQICIVNSGMDCDCVDYCHSSIVDYRGVFWFEKYEQDAYAWADGPLSIGFCRPDERPGNYSRDLALEAYENGHPHYITRATI